MTACFDAPAGQPTRPHPLCTSARSAPDPHLADAATPGVYWTASMLLALAPGRAGIEIGQPEFVAR